MDPIASCAIEPLSPGCLDDYLRFFDRDAFADNPGWAFCYCNFLFADHAAKRWQDHAAAENRAAVARLIEEGRLQGHLAYIDGTPVAWCNATPRAQVPALRDESDPDADAVGSILCFVVAKPWRRRGLATRLLAAACEGFARQGLRITEGYPKPSARGDGANHFGPLALFAAAGFARHREDPDGGLVMRRRLG